MPAPPWLRSWRPRRRRRRTACGDWGRSIDDASVWAFLGTVHVPQGVHRPYPPSLLESRAGPLRHCRIGRPRRWRKRCDRIGSSVGQSRSQGGLGVAEKVIFLGRNRPVSSGVIGLVLVPWQMLVEQRPVTTGQGAEKQRAEQHGAQQQTHGGSLPRVVFSERPWMSCGQRRRSLRVVAPFADHHERRARAVSYPPEYRRYPWEPEPGRSRRTGSPARRP
jgi:hypothetical protein